MAISDKITSIQDHLKDDWDSVESLIGDTELDKNIENISSALDDLYNDLPKVTGSGTSITLDDTRKGRLESTLSGNTSQTQYSGKNLLPPTIATETKDGITLTNNGDGSYTLTGTYSTSTTFDMALPATLNGTYSFSGNNPTAGKNIQFRILASSGSSLSTYLNNVNKTVENKTIENGTKQSIRIVGSFTSGFTFKPQLESGSTATSYEPYVGGVATPNPTTPMPVNVVSGNNQIEIYRKNRFTFNNLTDNTQIGVTVTYNNSELKLNGTSSSAGSIINNGTSLGITLPTGSYTFSIKEASGSFTKTSSQDIALFLRDVNSNNIANTSLGAIDYLSSKTFTKQFTLTQATDLYFYIYCNASGIVFNNLVFQIQIEDGSTATTYEPYQGNTYNIDLPSGMELCKIGNYQDYFAKSDGRNLFDKSLFGAFTTTIKYVDITLKPNTTYTMSSNIPITSGVGTNLFFMKYGETASTSTNGVRPDTPVTLTTDSTGIVKVGYRTGTGVSANPKTDYWYMINEGSTASPYQPYGVGKWYLHKAIGKVVLNGSENITAYDATSLTGSYQATFDILTKPTNTEKIILSDNFLGSLLNDRSIKTNIIYTFTDGKLRIANNITTSMNDFKTWLSNNNTTVYYVLATTTNTEITDTTLINQLEELYIAKSNENQTNISQINNDLPFIINATALLDANTYIMQLEAELEASS